MPLPLGTPRLLNPSGLAQVRHLPSAAVFELIAKEFVHSDPARIGQLKTGVVAFGQKLMNDCLGTTETDWTRVAWRAHWRSEYQHRRDRINARRRLRRYRAKRQASQNSSNGPPKVIQTARRQV